uniref:Uncharacterized protein n=1 Tax=Prolemur simus TaxID=1328070 RepID=A0A8C8ZKK6_PROSS
MHHDLSPHLHAEGCNILINLLKESHKNGATTIIFSSDSSDHSGIIVRLSAF